MVSGDEQHQPCNLSIYQRVINGVFVYPHTGFIDMSELITQMQANYQQWKAFDQQGITTTSDIQTKQMTLGSEHRLSMS